MFGIFEIDFKKLVLVALILALPLIALNLERRDTGNEKWYDTPVLWVVDPMQSFFTQFAHGVAHTTSFYLNLLDIKKENRLLKDEIAKTKQDLLQLEELKLENARLKDELNFQKTSLSRLAPAQVIAVDFWEPSSYSSLRLNKGSDDGLKKGMGVITRQGVVGYLLSVSKKYSTVLVLTDHNAVIDAAVMQRTRARGIVQGISQDLCQIKYLQRTDDVQLGDTVVTSGFDGIFPKGFPIGTVTKVSKKTYGVTQYVELHPIVDISRLEEVFVVMNPVNPPETGREDAEVKETKKGANP